MSKRGSLNFERDAKVLCLDSENSPTLGYFYGAYDTTPIKIERRPVLLAISWKWLGDKGKANGKTILDFDQNDRYDDAGLVKFLWQLLDEANLVVAHNAKFDTTMANTYFLRHGMTPPSPYKVFDTLGTARKFFHFENNKLDNLGNFLLGEGKTEVTYKDCWYKMLEGNDKEARRAAKLMDKYCRNDSDLLEQIYYRLRPWATNHPNMALLSGHLETCPRCGCAKGFRIRAYRKSGTQIVGVQYSCDNCHSYVTRKLDPEERKTLKAEDKLEAVFRNTPA